MHPSGAFDRVVRVITAKVRAINEVNPNASLVLAGSERTMRSGLVTFTAWSGPVGPMVTMADLFYWRLRANATAESSLQYNVYIYVAIHTHQASF